MGLKLFLKFCNYYKNFIAKWLEKTKPFIRMIKKMNYGNGIIKRQSCLKKIKKKFIKELILKIY